MFGLKEKDVEKIRSVFSEHPKINKVLIYGSRAKGNYRNSSDIDLSLIGEVDFDEVLSIETKIDDLLLPYEFDISILNNIKNLDLIEHINRIGQVFYEKENLITYTGYN